MGHLVLDRIAGIIATRRGSWEAYANALSDRAELELMSLRPGTEFNYAYFPVVFDTEARMLRVQAALLAQRIHGRRYFHPSLDTLPYVAAQECPVSRSVASRILCLPLYAYMEEGLVDRIAAIVKAAL